MNSIRLLAFLMVSGQASAQEEAPLPSLAPAASASASSAGAIRCSANLPVQPRGLSRRPGFQGATVVIELEILPPGYVGDVWIRQSTGSPEWEKAVIESTKKIDCTLGTPVTSRIVGRQTLSFNVK